MRSVDPTTKAEGEILFSIIDGYDTLTEIRENLSENRSKPTILEHLEKLEKTGWLKSRKEGRRRIYEPVWDQIIDFFLESFLDMEISMREGVKHEEVKNVLDFLKQNVEKWLNDVYVRGLVKEYLKGFAAGAITEEHIDMHHAIWAFSERTRAIKEMAKKELPRLKKRKETGIFASFLEYVIYDVSHSISRDAERAMEHFIRQHVTYSRF